MPNLDQNLSPVDGEASRRLPLSKLDLDYLLTPKELRLAGGPPERTQERFRVTGEGPPYVRLGAKSVRYRVRDYLKWIEAQTFSHIAAENTAAVSTNKK